MSVPLQIRFLASLVSSFSLGAVLVIGCASSPADEDTGSAAEAVDQAPPPRPAPLCQNPDVKDIVCSYVGFRTGTLIGSPVMSVVGVDISYAQDCKLTLGLVGDVGEYCSAGWFADKAQRSCPATADTVISVDTSGGTNVVPIPLASAQADLKYQCENIPHYGSATATGTGSCCPTPPPAPNFDLPPPLPFNPNTPAPLPANSGSP